MEQKNDDLKNRFTAWMEILIKRVRYDYLRNLWNKPKIISIDDVAEVVFSNDTLGNIEDIENQKLKSTIKSLSKIQQEVIEMLFIDELKPHEVAVRLGRSEQYIYNLRYRILKKLKELLESK